MRKPPSIRVGMRTLWLCTWQALRWQSIWLKPFHALSTGTRRKVCMAAALASGAPLTLIDDPIAGLDKPSVTYLDPGAEQLCGRARARRGG